MEPCIHCQKLFQKKYASQKFCSNTCSNRHNLNHKKIFSPPSSYTSELAELFGILLGDGGLHQYYMRIYLNRTADAGYPQKVAKLIKKALPGVEVAIIDRESRGTEEVQVSSGDVSKYLRSVGFDPKRRIVPKWIAKNETFTKALIRGLFDTEGSLGCKHFKGKKGNYTYYQLTFTNKNQALLAFVQEKLTSFGFRPTKTVKQNTYISNRKDIERYFREIGTSNPKLEKKWKVARMMKTT